MAEFRFYVAPDDRIQILHDILNDGSFSVTPNLNFPTSVPITYKLLTADLIEAVELNPRVYITGTFSSPLSLQRIDKGAYEGTFVVEDTRGGPSLSLTMPVGKIESEVRKIPPSSLFQPPQMWDEKHVRFVPAPDRLKQAYKTLKMIIGRRLCKLSQCPTCWLGNTAHNLYDMKRAAILVDGKWRTNIGSQ